MSSSCSLPEASGVNYMDLLAVSHEEAMGQIVDSFRSCGLQASEIGKARELLHSVLAARRSAPGNSFIAVSYTSNLISCGLREAFVALAKSKLVDVFITTAGGVEEDIIKCLGATLHGHFGMSGIELRKEGLNRIGNLLVPNDNYCHFETFFLPVLKDLHEKQRACRWTDHTSPSQYIEAMAQALAHSYPPEVYEKSLLYWCHRNQIPLFCPALTDGSMGDMIYFYNFSKKGLVVDPMRDVIRLRGLAEAKREASDGSKGRMDVTGIALGAGLPKHHMSHNLQLSKAIYVSTGVEADGCSSSCVVKDDRSMGLLSATTEVVRVHGDATVVFPLLLSGLPGNGESEGTQPVPAS